MATDLDARETTINYAGGSLTMTVGALKSLYGEDTNVFGADGQPMTVSVRGMNAGESSAAPQKRSNLSPVITSSGR